jgi:hypothetical protein
MKPSGTTTPRARTWGLVVALVLVIGGLVAAWARWRAASNNVHERSAHVDVELEVDFRVEDACLARVFDRAAEGVTSVRGYGAYAMPAGLGPDRSSDGAVWIQVVYADESWSTLQVVSEVKAEARPISSEAWRAAEKTADMAIETYLRRCVPAENVSKRSCVRWEKHSSYSDCGTGS